MSTVALPASPGELDAVYAKIAKRIIPFLALLFVMAWLDRYNAGFAKLQGNFANGRRKPSPLATFFDNFIRKESAVGCATLAVSTRSNEMDVPASVIET